MAQCWNFINILFVVATCIVDTLSPIVGKPVTLNIAVTAPISPVYPNLTYYNGATLLLPFPTLLLLGYNIPSLL